MNTALPPALVLALEAALPAARLDDVTPLGEGWSVLAYRVPDRGGDWVLRVPRALPEPVTGDLGRELTLVPWLESRALPVPRAMRALRGADGHLLGALHRIVEGRPASEASRERRARLAAALGAFLTELHALPLDEARAAGAPALDLWPDRYAAMVDDCLPLLRPGTAVWLLAKVEDFLAAGGTAGAPRALVHGDLGPGHVRLDAEGRIEAVLDWGDALVADPALDFATLWHGFGEAFMDRAIATYEGALDAGFRRRARFYVDVVPLFLVRYGHMFEGGADRRAGLRQLAARAAASTRRGPR